MLDAHVSPLYTRLAHVAVHAFSDATQAVMLSPREHMPCCSARYIVILINNVASVAGCCLLACCGGVLPLPLRLRLRSRLYLSLTIRYPVMKLYHCKDARSLRALWTLEEMGLAYELVNMKFPPRATHPGYLDVNPLGTVPTLVDDDVTLTESSAICHYLAEKYGPTDLAIGVDDPQYGEYLNWLYRSDATLTFPQTLVLRYSSLEPQERRIPQVVADYTQWFYSRLRSVELALEDRDYLLGHRFTVADIAVGYALMLGVSLGLDAKFKSNTQAYLARLMARPACMRACAL